MRKLFCAVTALCLTLLLAMDVFAATGAKTVGSYATVSSDGGCQVSITAALHLEQAVPELTFPVPLEAADVTLNGARVRTSRSGQTRQVDLSGLVGSIAGDFTINIHYSLFDVVQVTKEDTQLLQVPLLSGFAYPVDKMEVSVTLPGDVTTQPTFTSGYHQTNIEKDMKITVSGAVITGTCLKPLKDHETLTLSMPVTDEMFPRSIVELRSSHWEDTAIWICAGLALLYWLLFLRSLPPSRSFRTVPPEGYSAGQMGSILTMRGTDLSLTVLSWAQLGYILLQVERSGRVLLHKRMEMGNERSAFEQRCFQNLFGTRKLVDTSSVRYVRQCQAVRKLNPGLQELVRSRSGNPALFRVLAAGVGLFGGVSMGMVLSEGAALQVFWVFVMGVLGAVGGWVIQGWAAGLLHWNKRRLYLGLAWAGAWVLLGQLAGDLEVAFWVVLAQLLAGLMAFFGGRRTDLGRQLMGEVLGLRRYLRRVPREDLQRSCQKDPDYFHSLAPYALALDADKAFARRFGRERIGPCPYLTTGMDGHLTAAEWSGLMRRALTEMGRREAQMPMERVMELFRGFIKH